MYIKPSLSFSDKSRVILFLLSLRSDDDYLKAMKDYSEII